MGSWDLHRLRHVQWRFLNTVNPRNLPSLYGLDAAEFRSVMQLGDAVRGEAATRALFQRFARPNGRIDVTGLFAGLAVVCDGPLDERLRFLFSLFDFSGCGALCEDELTMLMDSVASGFAMLGVVPPPNLPDFAVLAGEAYYDAATGESIDSLSLSAFMEWAKSSSQAQLLIGALGLVPRFEHVLSAASTRVTQWHEQYCGSREPAFVLPFHPSPAAAAAATYVLTPQPPLNEAEREWDRDGDAPMSRACAVRDEDVAVLVGPVLGQITPSSVAILFELSAAATVTVHVSIVGSQDARLAPLTQASNNRGGSSCCAPFIMALPRIIVVCFRFLTDRAGPHHRLPSPAASSDSDYGMRAQGRPSRGPGSLVWSCCSQCIPVGRIGSAVPAAGLYV